MSNVKTLLIITAALIATNAFADDPNAPKGNWTEKFPLKIGGYVKHTPHHTCYNKIICSGKDIHIGKLHLKTNSSRDEFVAALKRSGLYSG